MKGELNPAKRPEVRLKISAALRGKSKSIEHREKIRKARLGYKQSAEHTKKRIDK